MLCATGDEGMNKMLFLPWRAQRLGWEANMQREDHTLWNVANQEDIQSIGLCPDKNPP